MDAPPAIHLDSAYDMTPHQQALLGYLRRGGWLRQISGAWYDHRVGPGVGRLRRPTQEALEITGELTEVEFLHGRGLRDRLIAHRSRVQQVVGDRCIIALRPLGPSPIPRTVAGLLAEFDEIIAEAPVDFLGTGESTRGANHEEAQWWARVERLRGALQEALAGAAHQGRK